LIAGGTPPKGTPPVLMQPEGATVDTEGNLYVADRSRNVVVKLDRSGKMLDPRYVAVPRPRTLAMDARDHLWIGSDGNAEAPWARGEGEIWRVTPQGQSTVLLRGTVSSGVSLDAHGRLFVADRAAATIFAVTSEGKRVEFATFTDGDAPRALAFAPDTPATRQAGIAGQLFVVRIARGAWSVNEVIRISGPFDQLFEGR
jgi:sugar lactone lactonase YvrE